MPLKRYGPIQDDHNILLDPAWNNTRSAFYIQHPNRLRPGPLAVRLDIEAFLLHSGDDLLSHGGSDPSSKETPVCHPERYGSVGIDADEDECNQ